MKKLILSVVIVSIFGLSQANSFEGLTLGMGVGYQQKPFIGDNSTWEPFPHIEYESGVLFVRGLKIGVNVLELRQTKFDVHLSYQSLNFKPSKAHGVLVDLDRRKPTLLLGAGINHRFDNNVFISAEINGDILGRSKGASANTDFGYLYPVNNHFTLIPAVGLAWDNKKHNRYYYGVSEKEATRTGLNQYRPGASITPHFSLSMNVKATEHLHLFGGMEMKFLPSKVKNSPITNRSTLSSFALGLNYNF